MQHKIFTAAILRALTNNGACNLRRRERDGNTEDFKPVVKVFNPYGPATWLLTELYDDGDTLFGLCDLGQGFPELGCVSKSEIESMRIVRGGFRLPLERDAHFTATHTLSVYAEAARIKQQITESRADLDAAVARLAREQTQELATA